MKIVLDASRVVIMEKKIPRNSFIVMRLSKAGCYSKRNARKDFGSQFNDLFTGMYFYLYFRILGAKMPYVGFKDSMCASVHMHKVR